MFATTAISGWLADNASSRRLPLLLGLALQVASACLFIGNPAIWTLLIARALQGASSAVIYSVGLALVVDTFGVQNAGEKSGYALSSATFGVISGPLLGGIVYDHAGYDAIVGLMVGLVGVDIALRVIMIEKKTAKKWMGGAVMQKKVPDVQHPFRYGTSQINNEAFGNAEPFPDVEPGAAGAENDSSQPASEHDSLLQIPGTSSGKKKRIPPIFHLIKEPRILADIYAVFVTYALLASFDSDLGLFVKNLFGWDSTGAGLIYLTIAMPSLLSPVAGFFSDRFGARWMAAGGFVANFVLIALLRFITTDKLSHIIALCVLMTLIGMSILGRVDISFVALPPLAR